jgi:hypothetical protein
LRIKNVFENDFCFSALIFLVNDSIWTFVFPSLRQNRRFMMANSIVIIAIINFQPAALFLVEVSREKKSQNYAKLMQTANTIINQQSHR